MGLQSVMPLHYPYFHATASVGCGGGTRRALEPRVANNARTHPDAGDEEVMMEWLIDYGVARHERPSLVEIDPVLIPASRRWWQFWRQRWRTARRWRYGVATVTELFE